MDIKILIVAIITFALMNIRTLVHRCNYYCIYNSIYVYIVKTRELRKKVMGIVNNVLFIITCGVIALVFKYALDFDNATILWGVGVGAFCYILPTVVTYRTYAFWKNPILLSYLLLDIGVVLYSLGISALFLGASYWFVLSLLIPIFGTMLVYYIETHIENEMIEATIETKLFVAMQKIKANAPIFDKKYGEYIKKYAKEYDLPEKFLRNLIIIETINTGGIYSKLQKFLLSHLLPFKRFRHSLSFGIGNIKPKTVEEYYGRIPKNIYKLLNDPEENIKLVAWQIRRIIDGYPGKDNYLEDYVIAMPGGEIEYETLDEVGQLCRYIVSEYETGYYASRHDFITISTDIMLKSDADQLIKNK